MRPAVQLVLLWGVFAYGCESGRPPLAPTPIGPTAAASPTPFPPPANPYWLLTTTLTQTTGQHVCPHWQPVVGRSVDWLMEVRRSGNTLTLVYDVRNVPTDHLELVGTINNDAFEAGASYTGYMPCGGPRLDYLFESRVAGRFSSDGTRISARETWSYRVASGDAFVYYFDWSARAPEP